MGPIDRVLAALPARATDEWATARDVATELGMGYSTAGKWLAQLVTEGRAEARKEGRGLVYRQTAREVETVAAAPVLEAEVSDAPAETADTAEPTDDQADTQPAPETPADGSVAAVAEWLQAVRPVSAAPATPAPRRRRDGATPQTPPRSWARGELKEAVLTHLRGLPEGEAHTPTQIARALNAYVGPVATNCQRQVAAGSLTVLDGAPVRYRAA